MFTSVRAYVIFGVIQVISSEFGDDSHIPIDADIPVDCYGPPEDINLFQCCPIEPLFTEKELALCGFEKSGDAAPWRFKDCTSRICVFKKNNLLNDDDTVNYEAMGPFMDKWAENQSNIVEGVAKAKEICFGKKEGPPIPQKPFASAQNIDCEIDKLLICIRSNVIWNCKQRVQLPPCKKLEDHMAKCKQYLYKEIPTE